MTPRPRVFVGITVLAAVSLLSACATGGRGQPAVLEGTTWRIVQVDGADVVRTDDRNLAPHLRILSAEGQVHGATGCNRFSARYMADGTSVRFGPLATTRMSCVDPALSGQESRIVDVLSAVDGYQIDGRWLWLMVGGVHRMTLEVW